MIRKNINQGGNMMYSLLIIDDEKKILDGITEIFPWNNIGFEVKAGFTSATKALMYLEQEQVDVVLTDICMPEINGLELTKKLKEYPDLLVVVFSSYSNYQYMREALQLDVVDYLLKPINYAELSACFEKVKQILDDKNQVSEQHDDSYYGKLVRRVDEYLEQHFGNGRLAEAAEEVGISAAYLSKIYKQKKGIGFAESLNRIRMEKAVEMLNDPEYKSYEIAYHVGYDSPKNFTRAFKSYYNMTPRDYRNRIKTEEENTC